MLVLVLPLDLFNREYNIGSTVCGVKFEYQVVTLSSTDSPASLRYTQ